MLLFYFIFLVGCYYKFFLQWGFIINFFLQWGGLLFCDLVDCYFVIVKLISTTVAILLL